MGKTLALLVRREIRLQLQITCKNRGVDITVKPLPVIGVTLF